MKASHRRSFQVRPSACSENVLAHTRKIAGVVVATLTILVGAGYAGADTWTTLDYPGTSIKDTHAFGISGNKIVGFYWEGESVGRHHGFVYDGTTWSTLDYPGSKHSYIWGISGTNIVGGYYDTTSPMQYHGYAYDGVNWTTPTYPGALVTDPFGTDGTQIWGHYFGTDGQDHGFVYDGANWTPLDYPGALDTWAQGISGNNVSGYYFNFLEERYHSFLYDLTTSTWTSYDFPGAQNTYGQGIEGNTVVGYYSDSADNFFGFRYDVPEPATFFLLTLGGLGVLSRRRRILKG